jgi:LPS sulfotransferase NodH
VRDFFSFYQLAIEQAATKPQDWMYNYLLHLRTYLIIKRKAILNTLDIRKKSDYTPFIILCQPRSGSTLLHTYLNSNPQIKSHGETLRERLEEDITALEGANICDLIFHPYTPGLKAVGLKIFYEYSTSNGYKEIFQQIVNKKDIHVIHLVRKDTLKLFTSLKIAEKTNVWSSLKASVINLQHKITIDPTEYEGFLKTFNSHHQTMNRLFENHPCLTVEYESLVRNPEMILESIQRFLKVKPRKLFTLLKKQSPEIIESIVENREDLRADSKEKNNRI